MRKPVIYSFITLSLILLSGCTIFQEGAPQSVVIDSQPAGADVYVNGEHRGETPVVARLGRKMQHSVVLEKQGFEPFTEMITPERVGGLGYVRFGLMEDTGLYNELKPDDVILEMRADILPESRTSQPFKEMAVLQVFVDQELKYGTISKNEHAYISKQLREYYTSAY